MIRVYCVGIHFNQVIDFVPDLSGDVNNPTTPPLIYMSGASILKACATKFGLRYKLTLKGLSPLEGHISYVSYTPTPKQDPNPRVTFGGVFPFYGQPLSLTEVLQPLGQPSQVIQYTISSLDPTKPTPKLLKSTGPGSDAQFGTNGFPDNIEIRIRSLNIYCTY